MSKPVFEKIFTFSGRRNRLSYNLYTLLVFVPLGIVLLLAAISLGGNRYAAFSTIPDTFDFFISPEVLPITALGLLPLFISAIAVNAQRCRDIGLSGWAVVLCCIPYLGTLFSVALMLIPGSRGPNGYGPDPLSQDALKHESAEKESIQSIGRAKNDDFEGEANLDNDSYKIFLVDRYQPRKIEILGKFECLDKLFDSTEEVLIFADKDYRASFKNCDSEAKIVEQSPARSDAASDSLNASAPSPLRVSSASRTSKITIPIFAAILLSGSLFAYWLVTQTGGDVSISDEWIKSEVPLSISGRGLTIQDALRSSDPYLEYLRNGCSISESDDFEEKHGVAAIEVNWEGCGGSNGWGSDIFFVRKDAKTGFYAVIAKDSGVRLHGHYNKIERFIFVAWAPEYKEGDPRCCASMHRSINYEIEGNRIFKEVSPARIRVIALE